MTDLDKLSALGEAASGGPSRVEPMRGQATFFNDRSQPSHYNIFRYKPDDEDPITGEIIFTTSGTRAKGDAEYVAALLDQAPALIARVRKAEAALTQVLNVCDDEDYHVGGAWGDYGEIVLAVDDVRVAAGAEPSSQRPHGADFAVNNRDLRAAAVDAEQRVAELEAALAELRDLRELTVEQIAEALHQSAGARHGIDLSPQSARCYSSRYHWKDASALLAALDATREETT